MMTNVTQLHQHSTMTTDQALSQTKREEWQDVLIIGYNKDESFCMRSSLMANNMAVFLLELAKRKIFEQIGE